MKEVIKKCEEKMTKTCENLDGEFANIRAGRANPNLLNRIMVEYYGTPTPMQQVGNISVPEPENHPDQSVGEESVKGYRESYSGI